jgi:hypothetical protein
MMKSYQFDFSIGDDVFGSVYQRSDFTEQPVFGAGAG